MEANDILQIAASNLIYISPFLLLICSLVFADTMSERLIGIVKTTRRYGRS